MNHRRPVPPGGVTATGNFAASAARRNADENAADAERSAATPGLRKTPMKPIPPGQFVIQYPAAEAPSTSSSPYTMCGCSGRGVSAEWAIHCRGDYPRAPGLEPSKTCSRAGAPSTSGAWWPCRTRGPIDKGNARRNGSVGSRRKPLFGRTLCRSMGVHDRSPTRLTWFSVQNGFAVCRARLS